MGYLILIRCYTYKKVLFQIIQFSISTPSKCQKQFYLKKNLNSISNRILVLWLKCLPMARETWVQSQVELYQRLKKWYLIPTCLTLWIIRYGSRVKWSNPGKWVASSSIPSCCSCRKGSLWVTLDFGRQLYLLISTFSGLQTELNVKTVLFQTIQLSIEYCLNLPNP